MLSSQDEACKQPRSQGRLSISRSRERTLERRLACKLEFRSEKIPHHSVHSNSSFFFNNFAPRRAGKVPLLGRLHRTCHKKAVFFSRRKNFGHVNVACNFGNFGYVWPCLVILGCLL